MGEGGGQAPLSEVMERSSNIFNSSKNIFTLKYSNDTKNTLILEILKIDYFGKQLQSK